jgi:hypothetical protein
MVGENVASHLVEDLEGPPRFEQVEDGGSLQEVSNDWRIQDACVDVLQWHGQYGRPRSSSAEVMASSASSRCARWER